MVLKNLIKARKAHGRCAVRRCAARRIPACCRASKRCRRSCSCSTSAALQDRVRESVGGVDAGAVAQATDADGTGPSCSRTRTNWSATIASIAEHRFNATHLDAVLERPGREPLHVHAVVAYLESRAGLRAARTVRERAAFAQRSRGAHPRSDRGQQGTDPQSRARDQESARRHSRRRAAARVRTRRASNATSCASTRRSSSRSRTGCRRWSTACSRRTGSRMSSAT